MPASVAQAVDDVVLARAKNARAAKALRQAPNDPILQEQANTARREYREAMLAEHIRKTVDAAPPLTSEQRDRLAVLLRTSA